MRAINLLPVELRPRKPNYRKIFIKTMVGLVTASLLGTYGWFVSDLQAMRETRESLQQEITGITPAVKRVKELEAQLANKRADSLVSIENSHLAWHAVMQEFANTTPSELWVTALDLQVGDTASTLNISGETISVGTVGSLAIKLRNLPYFSSVKIGMVQEDADTYVSPVLKYDITCSMAPLPEVLHLPKDKTAAAGKGTSLPIKVEVAPSNQTSVKSTSDSGMK